MPSYEKTIEKLQQALSQRLGVPVQYCSEPKESSRKWLIEEGSVIFPLSLKAQPAGSLKIAALLEAAQLKEIHHIVQWTMISLGNIFDQYEAKGPFFIEASEPKEALKQAYDFYEKSLARAFIHCQAEAFDPQLFSSDLKNTFLFISNVSRLSKEHQLFLSHFLRTNQAPFTAVSIEEPSPKPLLPSLLECFAFDLNEKTSL